MARIFNRGVVAISDARVAETAQSFNIASRDRLLGAGLDATAEFSGVLQYAVVAPGQAGLSDADKMRIRGLLALGWEVKGSITGNRVDLDDPLALGDDREAIVSLADDPPGGALLPRLQLVLTCEPLSEDFRWFDGAVFASLKPDENKTRDLGSEARKFRNLYLGGTIAAEGNISSEGNITAGGSITATETITAAGIIIPKSAGGNARIGGEDADLTIAEDVDAAILGVAPTGEDAEDPDAGRIPTALAVRNAIRSFLVSATYKEAAPTPPTADAVSGSLVGQRWPDNNRGGVEGQQWITETGEIYVWVRDTSPAGYTAAGFDNGDFPYARWLIIKGSRKIWDSTSAAGQLDEASASDIVYLKGATEPRSWEWGDFTRLFVNYVAAPNTSLDVGSVNIPTAAFIAGTAVALHINYGDNPYLDESTRLNYSAASTFAEGEGGGRTDYAKLNAIWGIF